MKTLNDNIIQSIEDFDDIQKALEEQGENIPHNTPTKEYAERIRNLSGKDAVQSSDGSVKDWITYTPEKYLELTQEEIDAIPDGTVVNVPGLDEWLREQESD